MGTTAACSKLSAAGLAAKWASEAQAYSAKAPSHQPNTWSPGRNRVTWAPTASTRPATSMPSTGTLGLRNPRVGTTRRIM
jgi:hypothetical protein